MVKDLPGGFHGAGFPPPRRRGKLHGAQIVCTIAGRGGVPPPYFAKANQVPYIDIACGALLLCTVARITCTKSPPSGGGETGTMKSPGEILYHVI